MNDAEPTLQPVLLTPNAPPRVLDLLALVLRKTTPAQHAHLARVTERADTLRLLRARTDDPRFECWEAHDAALDRLVLRCSVSEADRDDPEAARALLREAALRARLSHPNIASVHAIGLLDDGRPYFTADDRHGTPLSRTIAAVHQHSRAQGRWACTDDGWSLHRLIQATVQLCEATATAHAAGIAHRDITPHNITVDPHQHVWLTGFAHARELDHPEAHDGQARDLRALGALLAACLTGDPDHPSAPPAPDAVAADLLPDPDLLAIAQRALDPAHPDPLTEAAALASALRLWLEGEPRRTRAQRLLAEAQAAQRQATEHHSAAERLKADADAHLDALPTHCDAALREPWWAQLDRAQRHTHDGDALTQRAEQLLTVALIQDPHLHDARAALIAYHQARFQDAEQHRDRHAHHEERLKLTHHLSALPAQHAVRVEMERYVRGEGALTLVTEPSGAEVEIYRYEEKNRRLAEVYVRTAETPVVELPLEMGSYLLIIRKDGFAPTRYPVFIERLTHWHGVPPGHTRPLPVPLLPRHALPHNALYVPPGPFWAGGFARARNPFIPQAQRLWVDGFIIQRAPVTCAEHVQFLNHTLACHGEAEALKHAPVFPSETALLPVYQRDPSTGAFVATLDDAYKAQALGNSMNIESIIAPDLPITYITWPQAVAYSAWRSAQDGRAWRLPTSMEWEKAARGVDGRAYPWGEHFDPSLCHVHGSRPGFEGNVPVDAYPYDEGPYGMRAAAGGVREWCVEPNTRHTRGAARLDLNAALASLDEDAPARITRGGSSMYDGRTRPLGHIATSLITEGWADIGFRLVTTDLLGAQQTHGTLTHAP